MGYFDNIQFITGDSFPNYKCAIDTICRDNYSFEFIKSGVMRCSIGDSPSAVVKGPCVFWHNLHVRYVYGPADSEGWDHHFLIMGGERARQIVCEGLSRQFPSGFAPVLDAELFDDQFHQLLALALSLDASMHPRAVALLETMVAQTLSWSHGSFLKDRMAGGMESLMLSLQGSPQREPDFEREASRLGMSYANFRRVFKRLSGKATYEYLLHCRVRKAASLLRETRRQVKEIAWDLGFHDSAQFCKLFKGKMGMSPGEYRAKIQLPGPV